MNSKIPLSILMMLTLAACGNGNRLTENATIDHPLDVSVASKMIRVETDGRGAIRTPPRGWSSIALDFTRRGTSSMVIEGNREDVRSVSRTLVSAGVPAWSMELKVLGRTPGSAGEQVRVSYSAYDIKLPECGDFSSDRDSMIPDTYHTVSSNFGCSNQRNFGLMISNPGDLVARSGRLQPSVVDSGRFVGRISDYGTYERPPALPQSGGTSNGGR